MRALPGRLREVGGLCRLTGSGCPAAVQRRPGEHRDQRAQYGDGLQLGLASHPHRSQGPEGVFEVVQAARAHPHRLRRHLQQPGVPEMGLLGTGGQRHQVRHRIPGQGHGEVDPAGRGVHHEIHQIVTAGDIPVEGRGAGAQLLGHLPYGHGRQPVRIGQAGRGSGDLPTAALGRRPSRSPLGAFPHRPGFLGHCPHLRLSVIRRLC